jgi:hypothetical protein
MKRTYYIKFDTREVPGKLVAISVTLDSEIIADLERPLSINLSDDPLYPALCEHVRLNPPRKEKE